jgi:hypothetical protein
LRAVFFVAFFAADFFAGDFFAAAFFAERLRVAFRAAFFAGAAAAMLGGSSISGDCQLICDDGVSNNGSDM